MNEFSHTQYSALRAELLTRIAIQNGTISGAVLLAMPFAIATIALETRADILALAYIVCSGALALQWCHNGIRQIALKEVLMKHEVEVLGQTGSWEAVLPSFRPRGLLGSKWFVSTKGVFIGLQGFMVILPLFLGVDYVTLTYALALVGAAVTAWLLVTNPKE